MGPQKCETTHDLYGFIEPLIPSKTRLDEYI